MDTRTQNKHFPCLNVWRKDKRSAFKIWQGLEHASELGNAQSYAASAINMYCVLHQLYRLRKHRALKQSSINLVHYSGHGFRISTATTAAACGLEDSLIQTLGRWESTAYLRYITQPCRVYHWCVLLPWALLLLCALTWNHNCPWLLCSNLYLIAPSVILIIWTSPTVRDVLIINTPSTFRVSTVSSLQTFSCMHTSVQVLVQDGMGLPFPVPSRV